MNKHEANLKLIIHEAALDAGIRPHTARQAVLGMIGALHDDDDVFSVAAKALHHLCIDDGCFNRCTYGLKAVLRFLAEAVPEDQQPADDRPCIDDLAGRMRKNCTTGELRQWAREWYS